MGLYVFVCVCVRVKAGDEICQNGFKLLSAFRDKFWCNVRMFVCSVWEFRLLLCEN